MSGRITRTRLLAATTVAVAALSLTACGDTDASAVRNEGPAVSATATPSAGTDDAGTKPTTTPSNSKDSTDSKGSKGSTGGQTPKGSTGSTTSGKESAGKSGGGNGGSSRNPQCGAGDTRTIATPVSRPLNHLLLTVTNTGSKNCDLLGYPAARFGEAQSVPPVDESTHPQAVVTLAPGDSGYAGVRLSAADGSGTNGYPTKSLSVVFRNGSVAKPSLAGKGVYVDSSLQVTYWQADMDDALN
ncbi:DUF4232 domain-containing protein [Streptomyces sp. P9(2023)]|uniref:DUF4232 domain-containing protein n=1 Tax=Streptomyces sp. P9(2023) TaxID=3064394 RepID=UPI0028F42C4B|nr:DUF4232 domain-containing protein [Streptomyces sp. P9(2023)]MDT9693401.1 DUF4232 domain-containing protein [Streptomyces sp. P9(2023)]